MCKMGILVKVNRVQTYIYITIISGDSASFVPLRPIPITTVNCSYGSNKQTFSLKILTTDLA